jgi:hypothetical protein
MTRAGDYMERESGYIVASAPSVPTAQELVRATVDKQIFLDKGFD